MTRIPLSNPEDLAPEVADAYARGKLNLSLILAHASTAYAGYRVMTHAIFAQLTIAPTERELIVLAVLHLDHGEYAWLQHVEIALDIGISREKIDAIAADRFSATVFSDREKALLAFTRQVVRSVRVDDAIFNPVADFYNPRQLVEVIFAIGHYMTLARFSEVFELPVDSVAGAAMIHAAADKEAERQSG
jgi:alkylhydroperoxidase family enzyme